MVTKWCDECSGYLYLDGVQLFGKEIAVTIEELQAVLVPHRLLSQLVKFRSA
ncbi:hypothetical protein SFK315_3127 [Shigella flexneri K-315]|uniref:Uncharacterized protein n=1 Tax=Shigella flexneri K-315 TaxID=766150 RepID=I6CHQ4_SHIFL|nr:hypothetical protein SFK315_3127 [Shigella flexneri K-315]